MRLDNEKYIREHPELALVTRAFMKSVLATKPLNVTAHAYAFFSRDAQAVRQDMENAK